MTSSTMARKAERLGCGCPVTKSAARSASASRCAQRAHFRTSQYVKCTRRPRSPVRRANCKLPSTSSRSGCSADGSSVPMVQCSMGSGADARLTKAVSSGRSMEIASLDPLATVSSGARRLRLRLGGPSATACPNQVGEWATLSEPHPARRGSKRRVQPTPPRANVASSGTWCARKGSPRQVAQALDRSTATISRERERNRCEYDGCHRAEKAHERALSRRWRGRRRSQYSLGE